MANKKICGCGTTLKYGKNSNLYYCKKCDIELLYDSNTNTWTVIS